jgi:uncharacterized protein YlzI (FlbEa/FlbD family)
MLIRLINKNGDYFLLDARYIYEVSPTPEDMDGNATIFTTIMNPDQSTKKFIVMDTVDEVYGQIMDRENSLK